MLCANSRPPPTPRSPPKTPIESPTTRNTVLTCRLVKPRAFRMPMSRRFSETIVATSAKMKNSASTRIRLRMSACRKRSMATASMNTWSCSSHVLIENCGPL